MTSRQQFSEQRKNFWQQQTITPKKYNILSNVYHERMQQLYSYNVLPNAKVLELGCGNGDLLASLQCADSLGIDFCSEVIEKAKVQHPTLRFLTQDAHALEAIDETFDYIIISDLVNDAYDVEELLRQTAKLCTSDTRILINFRSHLWSGPLNLAQRLGFADKTLEQNWLTLPDLKNLLTLTGFEFVRGSEELILPIKIPFITKWINRILPRLWPFNHLALTHFIVARHQQAAPEFKGVSIIIAARNESGHISDLIDQIPPLGAATEVIFVEGGSSDDTYEEIERQLNRRSDLQLSLYRQLGKGKADAVRLGFSKAKYDVLMILDADISVMPRDLPRFYRAITENKGEFINGVRLVYPMQDQAMRFLNLMGNKFFSYGFQFALGQPIKDTLCGTKVISKQNYTRLQQNQHHFGDFDPFGDFDLILGSAKLNLKIIDIPIRYQARTYGETNINRWTGGALLLKMLLRSLVKVKFV